MSWTDKIQNNFVIRTGDGSVYDSLTLFWKNSSVKEIDYNVAEFNFPGVEGSKVFRGAPQGRKFSIEIYFQGDENVSQANSFEASAADPRAWTITHPIYGRILVQPTSLKFDYSGFNITQITGTLIETLGISGPVFSISPAAAIVAKKIVLHANIANLYPTRFIPNVKSINTLTAYNNFLYNIGSKIIKLTSDAGKYFNYFAKAAASIQKLLSEASTAISDLQTMINYVAVVVTTVKSRVSCLQNQYNTLAASLPGVLNVADKINYEVTGSTLVSCVCEAAITSYDSDGLQVTTGVNPDYLTRNDVLNIISQIQSLYNQYLADLDKLQTLNGGTESSYIPDPDSLSGLDDLINYTITNLYLIALSAKQERVIILEADSNLIILAHRFYGLLVDDSTIQTLMNNNNICLNEILQIKKGRTMSFYI